MQGSELSLHFKEFDEDAKKAYKVEITEVKDENGDGAVDLTDVQYLLENDKNVMSILKTGDFRSQECIELLKQADIVVTNPPFSLFREYIKQLMDYEKKFLIVGRQNAITYKEVFPLLKNLHVWLGYGFKGAVGHSSWRYGRSRITNVLIVARSLISCLWRATISNLGVRAVEPTLRIAKCFVGIVIAERAVNKDFHK